ncbi:methionyl-tRNA formyltransferase [candidate division WWE3 bacterium]|jgi:methionyl-tRNA formyltransferase|uniref:Methionyl-tRNA formyltransferase n=1 Tax=candidate division WWE3 bacterium TaxID=2053526 RepID=A0A3A4ZFU9_UNCKA|nr:MAG: methionyl-tRNA formyltransferase [candidate division WWE3 bacterium]
MDEVNEHKKLKVAFFGTSDRSIPILEKLNETFELVLCVTKNDVKVGRHQKLKETEVKKWAKTNNVKYVTISGLKGTDLEKVIEQLNNSNVDFVLVADFSFIIPAPLIETFPKKLINIHFSLLPKYRGASPVQHAILNGDSITGITIHLVEKRMDSGDILHQIGYKMAGNETSGTLYDLLFKLAAENITEVLERYSQGQITQIPQDEDSATYTYSPTQPQSTFIFKEDAEIKWKSPADVIERKIRAYNPWPIAWTLAEYLEKNPKLSGRNFILRSNINKESKIRIHSAELDDQNKLKIRTLQPEGRNKINWEEFENGYVLPVIQEPKGLKDKLLNRDKTD